MTLYDDMRRMETLIRASDLDWTIVRPSGLYHLPSVTDYTLVEGHADGRFTARADLAASMLALLDDDRYLRTTVGVITTVDNPTLLRWIRHEALAKSRADSFAPRRRVASAALVALAADVAVDRPAVSR